MKSKETNKIIKIMNDKNTQRFLNWKLSNNGKETDYDKWNKCINDFSNDNVNVINQVLSSISEL